MRPLTKAPGAALAPLPGQPWLGPAAHEARSAFERARVAGMTALRSWIVGQIASFRDCWVFRKRIAEWARCSVRTVQRAITEARSLGLIGVARAKPQEVPAGAKAPIACGWSHRWTIGWGKAAAQVQRLVTAARLAWITRRTTTPVAQRVASGNVEATAPPKAWTAAELDAELERLATR